MEGLRGGGVEGFEGVQGLHVPHWPKSRLEWYRDFRGPFLSVFQAGAKSGDGHPYQVPFSEALDGWRRAWVRWTPPEEARDPI